MASPKRATSGVSEAELRLVCTKTQISLVRNVEGLPFPDHLKANVAQEFADRAVATILGHVRGADVTDDQSLARMAEALYGLTPHFERRPAYRLLRLELPEIAAPPAEGLPDVPEIVWCEVLSANHLTFSLAGDFTDFEVRVAALKRFVDGLATVIPFAQSDDFGYLTAQLSLVGTGLRIRSWTHLVGLAHFNLVRELCNAAEMQGVLVEPDCSEAPPPGHLFILFNRHSLGLSTAEIVAEFRKFLVRVTAQELLARERLLKDEPFILMDLLMRLKALLRSSQMLNEQEALDLLSDLRLGLTLGAISSRRIAPLVPDWFDLVRTPVFEHFFLRDLKRKVALPSRIRLYSAWREEALRAEWMRPLATFSFNKGFLARAWER